MSTWTGGTYTGDREAVTNTKCTWQFCTIYVPQRFHNEGMLLCREHALLVWSIVNEQLAEGQTFEPQQPDHENDPLTLKPGTPFALTPGIPDQPGTIYYIRTGGRIKIGHSTNLNQRLAQYPPDTEILYLRKGDRALERSEHQRFNAYLADGREWFQDRHEVTSLIAAMAASDQGWERLTDGDWWRRRKRSAPEIATRNSGMVGKNGEFVAS